MKLPALGARGRRFALIFAAAACCGLSGCPSNMAPTNRGNSSESQAPAVQSPPLRNPAGDDFDRRQVARAALSADALAEFDEVLAELRARTATMAELGGDLRPAQHWRRSVARLTSMVRSLPALAAETGMSETAQQRVTLESLALERLIEPIEQRLSHDEVIDMRREMTAWTPHLATLESLERR